MTARKLNRDWHNIDWIEARSTVMKHQVDVLMAYRDSNYELTSKLQHDLVRRFAARALAVRRVTSNAGKATPGVDGKLWDILEI
jgi:RNA-directed DNA polymerase